MEVKKTYKGAIALDLDGVINSYKSGFVAVDDIPDPPVEGSFEAIKMYWNAGMKVYIFSTRNNEEKGRQAIRDWLVKWGLSREILDSDNFEIVSGKPIAKLYVDDRAFHFEGEFPSVEYVENFKPWHGGKSSSQE